MRAPKPLFSALRVCLYSFFSFFFSLFRKQYLRFADGDGSGNDKGNDSVDGEDDNMVIVVMTKRMIMQMVIMTIAMIKKRK